MRQHNDRVHAVCMCRAGGDKEPVAEQRQREMPSSLFGPAAPGGWRASEQVGQLVTGVRVSLCVIMLHVFLHSFSREIFCLN